MNADTTITRNGNSTFFQFKTRTEGQPNWVREFTQIEVRLDTSNSGVIRHTFKSSYSDEIIECEIPMDTELWNAVSAADNRDEFLRVFAQQLRLSTSGREFDAFVFVFNSWAPTREKEHGYGGGYWEKRSRVTLRGRQSGLTNMHYPQGYCRGVDSMYDSRAPRLTKDEIAEERAAGHIVDYWVVACYCG